jgi:Domain of unknown function (DUF4129)
MSYHGQQISSFAAAVYSVLSTQYSVLALILLTLLPSSTARADDPDQDDPVQSTKEVLARGGRFPWYDRSKDDVRRLNMVPRETDSERDVTWTGTTTTPTATPRALPRFNLFGGFLQWLGITVLVLLLGVIAYLIATSFLKDETTESVAVRKVVESRRDADRVEALPFHVRAASGDFLAEARRLYDAGRYSEAIVYLFSHQLVQLDKHHVIRLAKGKTNRQYVRETRSRPILSAVLETTMVAFEDAFFGNKTLSRETFERSWDRLNEFQLELQREELAAA